MDTPLCEISLPSACCCPAQCPHSPVHRTAPTTSRCTAMSPRKPLCLASASGPSRTRAFDDLPRLGRPLLSKSKCASGADKIAGLVLEQLYIAIVLAHSHTFAPALIWFGALRFTSHSHFELPSTPTQYLLVGTAFPQPQRMLTFYAFSLRLLSMPFSYAFSLCLLSLPSFYAFSTRIERTVPPYLKP